MTDLQKDLRADLARFEKNESTIERIKAENDRALAAYEEIPEKSMCERFASNNAALQIGEIAQRRVLDRIGATAAMAASQYDRITNRVENAYKTNDDAIVARVVSMAPPELEGSVNATASKIYRAEQDTRAAAALDLSLGVHIDVKHQPIAQVKELVRKIIASFDKAEAELARCINVAAKLGVKL